MSDISDTELNDIAMQLIGDLREYIIACVRTFEGVKGVRSVQVALLALQLVLDGLTHRERETLRRNARIVAHDAHREMLEELSKWQEEKTRGGA